MSDAIICLGNKINTQPEKTDAKLRAEKAIELYKSGRAKKIIFTGGSAEVFSGNNKLISEAKFMANIALRNNIPKYNIILEENATTTIENAKFSKKIVDTKKFKSAIVVTSKFHILRTKQIFKKIMPDTQLEFEGCSNNRNFFQLLPVCYDECIGMLKNLFLKVKQA